MSLFDDEPVPAETAPDLPPLRGTDKQCGWAGHIRKEKMAAVHHLIRQQRLLIDAHRQAGRDGLAVVAQVALTEYIDAAGQLERETHASYWISRRENSAAELLAGAEAKPGDGYR